MNVGVVEVDVVTGETGQLAPPHAGVRGGDDHDLVDAPADATGDGGDLRRAGVWAFGPYAGVDAYVAAWVVRDAPVLDGLAEHKGQYGDHVGGRPRGELGLQLEDEGFDVLAADCGQGQVAEAGQDVQP
jgi:hypothetical protein